VTHGAFGELMRVNYARVNSIDQRTRAPAMCASTRLRSPIDVVQQFGVRTTSRADRHPTCFTQTRVIERRGDELVSARAVPQQQQFFSPGDGTDQLLTS
jgi:hypothetical protein